MHVSETAACRILIVCSSQSFSHNIVTRLIGIPDLSTTNGDNTGLELVARQDIPWTITNKYYTAEVHFRLVDSPPASDDDEGPVPALIFVWEKGQEFKTQFLSHLKDYQSHDSEVALAVAVSTSAQSALEMDQEDADAFFGDLGFEYIDGDIQGSNRVDLDAINEGEETRPGRARIIDALNSIMWPSMVRNPESHKRSRHRSALSQDFQDPPAPAPLIADNNFFEVRISSNRREMVTESVPDSPLFKITVDPALGTDETSEKWPQAGGDDQWPTHTPAPASPSKPLGFDDDFSEFVTPPLRSEYASLPHDPELEGDENIEESERLVVTQAPEEADADPFDEDALPSQAEILSTSQQIFGGAHVDENGGFDLSSILGTLQMLKEEIGGLDDEDRRRKAAARIALGFVWGLEQEKDEP